MNTRLGACVIVATIASIASLAAAPAAEAAAICGGGGIATKHWDGGAPTDSWHEAANWTPDGVPGATDDVCLDNLGTTVFDTPDQTGSIKSLEATGTLQMLDGGLTITDASQTSSIDTLALDGSVASLGGEADLTIDTFDWSGGDLFSDITIPTRPTVTVTGSLTFVSSGNFKTVSGGVDLVIPNGVTATANSGFRLFGSTLEIEPGGVLDFTVGTSVVGSDGLIVNGGTLKKTISASQLNINVQLDNRGTVSVESATLELVGNSTTDTDGGVFQLANGTTLRFDGGNHLLGQSAITDGPNAAIVETAAGSVDLDGNGAVDVSRVDGLGGTLLLDGTNTIPTVNLSGGTLGGAGNLTIGTFSWTGGTHSATNTSATTTLGGNATITGATNKSLATRRLQIPNGFTVNHADGGALDLSTGARLATQAGGTYDVIGTGSLGGDGTGTIVNAGTFRKSAAGVTTVNPAFQTTGTIAVNAGTLNPVGDLTNGGTLRGTGTIAADVTNNGTVAPGTSPGTLTVNGDYAQSASGTLQTEVDGTGIGQFDVLSVTGAATLAGTLAIDREPGFVPVPGNTFEIIQHTSRTGIFSTITGASLTGPEDFVPDYGTTETALVVRAPAVDAPQIASTDPASPSMDGSPRVRGSLGAGDPVSVRLYVDDPSCAAPAGASGTVAQFTGAGIVVDVPPDATSAIRARAVDAAGNESGCSSPIAYREDSSPPDTQIDPGPSGTVTSNDVAFTYSAIPAGDAASFECRLDSDPFAACSASGSSFTDLADGAHTFEVRAIDAVGQIDASPAIAQLTIDTTPRIADVLAPDTVLKKKPPRKVRTDERKARVVFKFTGSDATTPAAALGFKCEFDRKPIKDCQSPLRKKAKPGKHVFSVAAIDAAGNLDPSPAKARFKVISES